MSVDLFRLTGHMIYPHGPPGYPFAVCCFSGASFTVGPCWPKPTTWTLRPTTWFWPAQELSPLRSPPHLCPTSIRFRPPETITDYLALKEKGHRLRRDPWGQRGRSQRRGWPTGFAYLPSNSRTNFTTAMDQYCRWRRSSGRRGVSGDSRRYRDTGALHVAGLI